MGRFPWSFVGYRRGDVEAAIVSRDAQLGELERELSCLSGMVIEREREIRGLHEQLREATARHDRSLSTLDAITERLTEIEAQARGQATRIRMQALREAAAVSRRAHEMVGLLDGVAAEAEASATVPAPERTAAEPVPMPAANGAGPASSNGSQPVAEGEGMFQGLVRVEIGPLGDFSQLVGFEDAAAQIGAMSEISVERFSEGRATLSMQLDEPVELLGELERLSPLDFSVRRVEGDELVLDVDDDAGEAQAA